MSHLALVANTQPGAQPMKLSIISKDRWPSNNIKGLCIHKPKLVIY